jgi:hypothetical protein
MTDPTKHILTSGKFKISTPHPSIRGKHCKFGVGVLRGMPRFILWTDDPNESSDKNKDYGKIVAAMDYITFMSAVKMVAHYATVPGTEELRTRIDCLNHDFKGGKRSETPSLQASLIIGRDKDGIIYASVISADGGRVKVKVPFKLPDARYHTFTGQDGRPLSATEESKAVALGWAESLMGLMPQVCYATYEAPVFQGNNAAGGGGGYQRQGQQGGGQQRPAGGGYQRSSESASASEDIGDDIPF